MLVRAVIATALMLGAALVIHRGSEAQAVALRQPLSTIPMSIGDWRGHDLPAWDDRVLDVLGADEHLNRRYVQAGTLADLYVGYYRSQRQGDSIHSPQNCLPGAGWQPVSDQRVSISVGAGESISVNQYVIQKDLDRQVVLYWFQGRGRVVASEYANRAYLVLDALRTRRSDGALVRVMSPVFRSTDEAAAAAASFARAVYPRLTEVFP